MMKRSYLRPVTKVVKIKTNKLLIGSPVINSNRGIDYGGVDSDGSYDPS